MNPTEQTLAWLAPRLADVPEELAEAVRACVRRAELERPGGEATVARLLAAAAVQEFDRVVELEQDRRAAIRLLAADASLTYAFEAASEAGPEEAPMPELSEVGERIAARLARLMAERDNAPAPDGADDPP